MERHVARCSHCKGSCDALKRVLALCRRSAAVDVPENLQQSVRAGIRAYLSRE